MSLWRLLGLSSTVLVQGAHGNIGRAIVSVLLKERGLDLKAGVPELGNVAADQVIELGASVVEFKYQDINQMVAALRGIRQLVIIPPNRAERVQHIKNIVAAASDSGIRHIVMVSIIGVDTSVSSFAREYTEMEEVVMDSGIPYTFLRCGLFAENYLWWSKFIMKRKLPLPTGDGKFAPLALADLGKAVAAVLQGKQHKNKFYDLTGPSALSGKEQAQTFTAVLRRKVEFVELSWDRFAAGLHKIGLHDWQIKGFLEIYRLISEGKFEHVSRDVQRLTDTEATSLSTWVNRNRYFFCPC